MFSVTRLTCVGPCANAGPARPAEHRLCQTARGFRPCRWPRSRNSQEIEISRNLPHSSYAPYARAAAHARDIACPLARRSDKLQMIAPKLRSKRCRGRAPSRPRVSLLAVLALHAAALSGDCERDPSSIAPRGFEHPLDETHAGDAVGNIGHQQRQRIGGTVFYSSCDLFR
jgi:hypothetical protein